MEGPSRPVDLLAVHRQVALLEALSQSVRDGGVDGVLFGEEEFEQLYTLADARRPYKSIVEGMSEGAITVSPRHVVLFTNLRFAEMVGSTASAIVGKPISAFLGAAVDRDDVTALLSVEPGESAQAFVDLLGSGGAMPVSLSASCLDVDGLLVRCLIATNLTSLRAHERQLEQQMEELARSNDELEQFAYVASHDLSEPLRAISGPISLLAHRYQGQLDDEADALITFAVDGCLRMQALIDGLLRVSRVGRDQDDFEEIDLDAVMDEVLVALGPMLVEAGATVTVEPLPTLRVDRTQMAQVLQNLVANAVKFVAPGVAPTVDVRATREAHVWRITVSDNGIGIAEAHRQRIFGIFKRLHGRTEYAGTGIGLALVEKIIERHQGLVGVEDNPEASGSRFWFTLPLSRAASAAPARSAP
jgi:signal transduction histidine kinase